MTESYDCVCGAKAGEPCTDFGKETLHGRLKAPTVLTRVDTVMHKKAFGDKLFEVIATDKKEGRFRLKQVNSDKQPAWFSAPANWRIRNSSSSVEIEFILPETDIVDTTAQTLPAGAAQSPPSPEELEAYHIGIEEGRNQVLAALIAIVRREL